MKKFKIDFSFLILLGIIALSPKQFILLKLLFCLLIHEIGHLFFVFLFHYKIENLKLSLFGFFLKLSPTKRECIKDVFLYAGGILMNALCILIIPDASIRKISLLLILFNSLPVYPLDGFNVIHTILSYFFPYKLVLKSMGLLSVILSIGTLLICIVCRVDVFIICNAIYLFLLSLIYYWNMKVYFQKFLLEKTLYSYSYPLKTISLTEKLEYSFYKYHTIQIKIGNKFIPEKDVFLIRNQFR